MNNVAINLVATMMQSKFSSGYANSVQGAAHSSFTNVLSQTKVNSNETSIDKRDSIENNSSKNSFGKTSSIIHKSTLSKTHENLEKLNQKKRVNNPKRNDEQDPSKIEVKTDDNAVKETVVSQVVDENAQVIDGKVIDEEKVVNMEDLSPEEKQLIESLANQLNLNSDQLIGLMNQLQMTITDLFDMQHLKTFVSEALGVTNQLELLTTDGAMEMLRETSTIVNSALENNPELAKVAVSANAPKTTSEEVQSNVVVLETQNEQEGIVKGLRDFQQQSGQGGSQSGQSSSSEATIVAGKATTSTPTDTSTMTNGFEGALNQVVTQKTETIIMDGAIQTIHTEVTAKDVFDQIVTGLKVQVTEGKSSIMLQLEPQNLGKIALNLITENGNVTGHFVAESEAVKEVIESNLAQLKSQLQSQGIEVGELKITVGNSTAFFTGDHEKSGTSNGNQSNKSNKRFKIGNINEVLADKIREELAEERHTRIHEDSSIELHA